MTDHNTSTSDVRQRFYFDGSPVRGDVVRLASAFAHMSAQKDYPEAIKRLLGEMMAAASLLIGTLKVKGHLSIQIQANTNADTALKWATAECDHQGQLRALADWDNAHPVWHDIQSADEALAQLGDAKQGVMFINVQPEGQPAYQGIVERRYNHLADCLTHYQMQSMQIPTAIVLACDGLQSGGMLLQALPLTTEERLARQLQESLDDDDLWQRLRTLTHTLKAEELTHLPPLTILYRLYHEEHVRTDVSQPLHFGCTCSQKKCAQALKQIGEDSVLKWCQEQNGQLSLDCHFCGSVYHFSTSDVHAVFADD